jgi:hypothetical protein
MIHSGRSNTRRRLPIEWIVTLVAALLALAWWVTSRPFVLDPLPERQQFARVDEPDGAASVLIVLPQSPDADSLTEMHFDRTWLNTVEQEIGAARVVNASRLSRADMDPCEWVIIPRHATAQLDPTQIQYIRTWVEDGGAVLLEQPDGPWQGLTGQNLTGMRRTDARRITGFDGAVIRGTRRDDLITMPIHSPLVAYNPPDLARGRDYEVLMEIDGQPAIIKRAAGRGTVLVLLFDMGQAVGLMQQGTPTEDLTLPREEGVRLPASLSSVNTLIASESLTASAVPYADLLERNVLYLLDQHVPVGRLWLYPGRSRGALVVSHSESGVGPLVGYQAEWEHDHEENSTIFAVAGSMPPEPMSRLGRLGADVQFQWVPAAATNAPQRTWGIGRLQPVRRPMTLEEQLDRVRSDLFPYGPPTVSRTRDGLWPQRWLEGFRALEAAGVRMDASLGPVPPSLSAAESNVGYMFGTGYVFHPLDSSGGRFGLRELPTHVLDVASGYGLDSVRRLIVDSSDRHHTAVVGDWRPDTMALRPSFDALEAWRASFTLARSQELWVTTHARFLEFIERRSRSRVRSRFSTEERALTIEVEVEGASEAPDGDATALTPSITFPVRHDGRSVQRVLLDGLALDLSLLPLTGDRILHIVALQPGQHRLQVFYATGSDQTEPLDP